MMRCGGIVLHNRVPGGDGLSERIGIRVNPQIGCTIVRRVLLALMFDHVRNLRVPGVSPQAIRVIDRNSGVVTDLWARCPLGLVLMLESGPLPGQIQLSRRTLSKRP